MKKKIFLIGSLIIGIGIFVTVLMKSGLKEVWELITNISWTYLGLFFLISIIILITRVLKWMIILKTKNVKIGFIKLFMYKITEVAISFLTPMAFMGGGVAVTYLFIKEGIEPHLATSSVVLDKTLELVTNTLFTLIGAIVLITTFTVTRNIRLIMITGPIILIVGMIIFYKRILKEKPLLIPLLKIFKLEKNKTIKKYGKEIKKSEKEVVIFFKEYPLRSLTALIISFGGWMMMFLEFKFLLLAIGQNVGITTIYSVIAIVGFAYIVPVPAAIGVLEGGQASLFKMMGLGASIGVTISLLLRIRDLIWTFFGLIYMVIKGIGIAKKDY